MAGLLKGVRVLESAQLITGDFTGQLLADEGADVIKVESPFRGDYIRHMLGQVKPHEMGHSPIHISLNRNKRSVTVNLQREEGKEIFWRMLADTDVFLDGNTTGTLDRLGVGYAEQRKVKPDIIYADITGLGASGPYAKLATHGGSMNAVAGATPCELDEAGNAVRSVGLGIDAGGHRATGADIVGPLFLAYGVAASLWRRTQTGEGAYLDVGCSDALVASCWMGVVKQLNAEKIWADQQGVDQSGVGAKYTVYETKDGKFILIALIEKYFWEHFCEAIDRADLLEEGVGYIRKDAIVDWGPPALHPVLQGFFRSRTQAEWVALGVEHDCVIAPCSSTGDLLTDPHLLYREAVVTQHHPTAGDIYVTGNPIKVAGERYEIRHHAPALGEQTFAYLGSLGYEAADLERWKEAGII